MEKISIDKDNCVGCGACFGSYPELFKEGEDGLAEVVEQEKEYKYSEDEEKNVEEAESACAGGAISHE